MYFCIKLYLYLSGALIYSISWLVKTKPWPGFAQMKGVMICEGQIKPKQTFHDCLVPHHMLFGTVSLLEIKFHRLITGEVSEGLGYRTATYLFPCRSHVSHSLLQFNIDSAVAQCRQGITPDCDFVQSWSCNKKF